MQALRLPVWSGLSAAATAVSFFLFAGPLVSYILEPSSTRSANCLDATVASGTFGDGTKFAGVLLLGTAITTIVFGRRALAAEEERVVAWSSLIVAGLALVGGIVIFTAAVVANTHACNSWL